MSLSLKSSNQTTARHEPELGVDAIATPRLDVDCVNALEGELDRILARKPVARPINGVLKPANSNRRDLGLSETEGDGFSWVPDIDLDEVTQATEASKATSSAASAAWLDKARSDKRRKSRRNAAAWAAALVITASVLAASAHILTGWSPELSTLRQVAENWTPNK